MIYRNDECVRLEFGCGDICIVGGYTNPEDIKKGFVIFSNQDPREIGSAGDIKAGEVDLDDYPVVLLFSKKESIDVLIEQLEIAKTLMD